MAPNAATALAAKTKASKAWTQIMERPLRFRGRLRQADPLGAVRSGGVGSEGETYGSRSAADRLHIDDG
jgi:hypothetical protein